MILLEERFAEYAAHHQHLLNKLTHAVGIPLIALGLFGLGSKLTLGVLSGRVTINVGTLLIVVLVIVYMQWHRGLAVAFLVLAAPLYVGGLFLPASSSFGVLAVGVALQYVGHFVFERRKPAFHDNLVHTVIGPLWMVSLLFPGHRRRCGGAVAAAISPSQPTAAGS